MMTKRGLFVGLVTLDLIYLATAVPRKNQKVVANDHTIAAGGPATNAAVTFSYLHNRATVLGAIGTHPLTHLIQEDLAVHQVVAYDLNPSQTSSPPVSSIIVSRDSGDRAVISINATKTQIPAKSLPEGILSGVDIVLIDGHQMEIGRAVAQLAKLQGIPVVIDGGSWKPGFERVLPFVDYAICSANFYPPDCEDSEDVIAYLSDTGVNRVAITYGEKPIQYFNLGQAGLIDVPQVEAVDTVGAGDIFHGAFCHYIMQADFIKALESAAKVASCSCQFFGTRRWLQG